MGSEYDFVEEVLEEFGPVQQFKPCAYYDESGDCIEFMLSQAPFLAKRINNRVTIYLDEKTGNVSGGLIKDIRKFMQSKKL